jgi:NAD(P)-dependent dehydrogenase (short-subunit alcohol dehydrogenase family)
VQIDGSVALVFGGGGLLGSATARRLALAGASVVVADRAPGRAGGEVAAGMVRFVETDAREPAAVDAAVATAVGLGDLRIAVNCVGAGLVQRTLSRDGARHSLADFREMVELNLVAAFTILVGCADAMSAATPDDGGERGVIVNTSSLAGLEGSAGQIAYGAAKAGVAGMTLPAARDLAPLGIRVMTIAPGGMTDGTDIDLEAPGMVAVQQGVVFPPRFGTPDEYALTVQQLVENTYLNGSVVRLDGGARLGKKF